jgi:hypothetical protein
MDTPQPNRHTPLDRQLTDDEQADVYRVLGTVPVVGLPHGGMGAGLRPKQWDEVLVILSHLGDTLGTVLRENEQLREAAYKRAADMQAVGRVLRQTGVFE